MDDMITPLSAEQREEYRQLMRAHRAAKNGRETQLARLARIAEAPAPARIKIRWDNVILGAIMVLSVAIPVWAWAVFFWTGQ